MATEQHPVWETAALEATISALARRSPDKLHVTDTARARERFDKELARQIERHGGNDDPDWLLKSAVFDADLGDPLVETNAYPRNAGMASGLYQALKAYRLPSGATVYYDHGEWERKIRAVSASNMDDHAATMLGEIIALPTHFYAGDALLEIDKHLSAAEAGGWIHEALLDHEAGWIEQDALDRGGDRRAELQEAIDDAAEEDDAPEEQLEHAQELLDATPPWFLLLEDKDLDEIADYPLPDPDRSPPLENTIHPWMRPTQEIFLDPNNPTNLQHIVAAYLRAR